MKNTYNPTHSLELVIDGKRVPMNPFVREIVTSAILGVVLPLKRVNSPQRIEITIERSSTEGSVDREAERTDGATDDA